MNWETIFLLIVDDILIAILILIAGLWINRKLESHKSILGQIASTQARIAEGRLPAYQSLWALTAPLAYSRTTKINYDEKQALHLSLCNWYYESGNGLFLSSETRNQYFKLREILLFKAIRDDALKEKFSDFRTVLKNEIGIYGKL